MPGAFEVVTDGIRIRDRSYDFHLAAAIVAFQFDLKNSGEEGTP